MFNINNQYEDEIIENVMNFFIGNSLQLFGITQSVKSVTKVVPPAHVMERMLEIKERTGKLGHYTKTYFKEHAFILEDDTCIYFDIVIAHELISVTDYAFMEIALKNKAKSVSTHLLIPAYSDKYYDAVEEAGFMTVKLHNHNLIDIDGDNEINEICNSITTNGSLSKRDMLLIALYPILNSNYDTMYRVEKSIEIALRVRDLSSENSEELLKLIYFLLGSFWVEEKDKSGFKGFILSNLK